MVEEWALWRARKHRTGLIDQHRQRQRRIHKPYERHLHRWDEEQSHHRNQNPLPAARKTAWTKSFTRFTRCRCAHRCHQTAKATWAQPRGTCHPHRVSAAGRTRRGQRRSLLRGDGRVRKCRRRGERSLQLRMPFRIDQADPQTFWELRQANDDHCKRKQLGLRLHKTCARISNV